MNYGFPTGLVGHAGITVALAYFLRLNLAVTLLCGVLPDLVDKPLTSLLWISEGRYIAHTLPFVFLVSIVFFLWNKPYGIAALFGGILHLLMDLGGFIPWFYPFVDYEFTYGRSNLVEYFHSYLSWPGLGMELIAVALVGLALYHYRWLYRRYSKVTRLPALATISRFLRPQTNSVLRSVLFGILLLAVLGAVIALGYRMSPNVGESAEFYILGPEGKAEGYPETVSIGEEMKVILGIINQEQQSMAYMVDIIIEGDLIKQIGPIDLAHEQKWEEEVGFMISTAGENQKVEFKLYKIRELESKGENHTSLSLWLGREEPIARVRNHGRTEASYKIEVAIINNEGEEAISESIGPVVLASGAEWHQQLISTWPNAGQWNLELSLYRNGVLLYEEELSGGYPAFSLFIDVEE